MYLFCVFETYPEFLDEVGFVFLRLTLSFLMRLFLCF
jgi:hypothetical protein